MINKYCLMPTESYLIYDPLFKSIVVPLIYSGDSVANHSIALAISSDVANLLDTIVFKNAYNTL